MNVENRLMQWTEHTGAPVAASELQFVQLLNVCQRRWRLIASVAAVGTALITLVLLSVLPRYTATALAIYHARQGDMKVAGGANQAVEDAAVDTQISMLTARDHLQRVVESLAPVNKAKQPGAKLAMEQSDEHWPLTVRELQRRLTVTQFRRSPVIAVSFTASSPAKAAAVANRVVQLFIDGQTEQLLTNASRNLTRFRQQNQALAIDDGKVAAELDQYRADGLFDSNLRFMSRASPPDQPSSPSLLLLSLVALVGFTLCGAVLAVLLDLLDRGLRGERQVSGALGVPCIGLVPWIRKLGSARPHQYLLSALHSAYAESIRSLAASTLQLGSRQAGPKTILVTSSLPGEGKTTLAVSLAAYSARIGLRVLLLDLDSRRPATLREVPAEPDPHALDLLLSGRQPENVVQYIPDLGFDYVPSPALPVPSAAQNVSALRQFAAHLRLAAVRARTISDAAMTQLKLFVRTSLNGSDGNDQRHPASSGVEQLSLHDPACEHELRAEPALSAPPAVDLVGLLAGGRMARLLTELRENYDLVVIDGPSLLGATEARLLAALADKVLLAVQWGKTSAEVAHNALQSLRRDTQMGLRIANCVIAVVTRVDIYQHAKYRFGDSLEFHMKRTSSRYRSPGPILLRPVPNGEHAFKGPLLTLHSRAGE